MDICIAVVIVAIIILCSGLFFTVAELKKPVKEKDDLNERLKSIEDRIYALQLQCDEITRHEDEITEFILNIHDHLIDDDDE